MSYALVLWFMYFAILTVKPDVASYMSVGVWVFSVLFILGELVEKTAAHSANLAETKAAYDARLTELKMQLDAGLKGKEVMFNGSYYVPRDH